MSNMLLSGIDVSSGSSVEVSFDRAITIVDHLIRPLNDGVFIAPGWIDLQVNGFAGVDYNSAASTHEEIARRAYEIALDLTQNPAERAFLASRIAEVSAQPMA